jgi:hypothetical protein
VNELLGLAIEGHGGMRRWREISRLRAVLSITGEIWKEHRKDGLLDNVTIEAETRDQRLTIAPFPGAGRYATWEPHRRTIETAEGVPIAERRDVPAPLAWDDLDVAYLAAEACWTSFTAPFLFARPDFTTAELGPWVEDGQIWQRLRVTYPACVATHGREQVCYFDGSGFLCRVDFTADILGGARFAQYPTDYCEFDGILVPTRRLTFVRDEEGAPDLGATVVAVDVEDVMFLPA